MRHLDEIVDFIIKHIGYYDRDKIKEYIQKHIQYGTFDYAVDEKKNIIGCVRFNVTDGDIFDVFDFSIDKEWRRKGIGKDMILRALKKFPDVRYIRFQRFIRGDERYKIMEIDKIIKRNIL